MFIFSYLHARNLTITEGVHANTILFWRTIWVNTRYFDGMDVASHSLCLMPRFQIKNTKNVDKIRHLGWGEYDSYPRFLWKYIYIKLINDLILRLIKFQKIVPYRLLKFGSRSETLLINLVGKAFSWMHNINSHWSVLETSPSMNDKQWTKHR